MSNINSAERKASESRSANRAGGTTPQPKKGSSIKEESEGSGNEESDYASINFKNSIYSKIRGDPSVN